MGTRSRPARAIVCTQAWSVHCDPVVFRSPKTETFLRERWLPSCAARSKEDSGEASETEAARLARMVMPFGTGLRICGGVNLADAHHHARRARRCAAQL
ncbi:hypothetical protein B0H16DRAFT_1563120 [Mycena metata]|uniref:Cytochrome P450 n=1 Tax=Mycena metata TaxID=1033252 RepID=A0AAD7IGR4_9AGAR|nr:hypothetical protein B0H16DRAFT_1563120 [Mycena metata]